MDKKTIGDKILSEATCTLCNLGVINPQELYTNSQGVFTPTPLVNDNCKTCAIYEQLIQSNTNDTYTKKKN